MDEQSFRRKKIRLTPQNPQSQTAAAKFMSIVSDDELVQIFLRLPDYRCLIRCGIVCKRWYSLIFRSKYFRRCFNHLHRQKRQYICPNDTDSLPSTLLIRCLKHPESHDFFTEKKSKKYVQGEPLSLFTISTNCLDFLDWSDSAVIRSSFDDLLLVQRDAESFYICNPITRQCVALPGAPVQVHGEYRCGFVCDPRSCCNEGVLLGLGYCNCDIKYRVVLINEIVILIFSSETGQWKAYSTERFFERLGSWHRTPVGSNGILYWPEGSSYLFRGIVAFDPFSEQCRLISLPEAFRHAWKAKDYSARLGVVRGKLRLSQFFWKKKDESHVLKTWELDETAAPSSWVLVDSVALRSGHSSMFLVALHPDDEDVVFFSINDGVDNVDICRYDIGRDTCENMCEFPNVRQLPSACIFTLLHPWWPTTIPALPSN